jgi:hypothetical protein
MERVLRMTYMACHRWVTKATASSQPPRAEAPGGPCRPVNPGAVPCHGAGPPSELVSLRLSLSLWHARGWGEGGEEWTDVVVVEDGVVEDRVWKRKVSAPGARGSIKTWHSL